MVRGYYTAVSGMVTQEKKLNVIANNMANVSTAGFKKDALVEGTFGEHVAARLNQYQGTNASDIGPGVYMTTVVDEYTDYSQGAFEQTDNPYSIAIKGGGYFVIREENGVESLTRNGQFALDSEGYLCLPGYGRVQGEYGDIELADHRFSVAKDGTIYLQDPDEDELYEIDRIFIALPQGDENSFKKTGNEMFEAMQGYTQADFEDNGLAIMQGVIEKSNVNVADEMSLVIATQRNLQSCSQIVKMYDELTDLANSKLSRV